MFKTYLKILKTCEKYFRFLNRLLFYKNHKTVFLYCSQKLFFRIFFK